MAVPTEVEIDLSEDVREDLYRVILQNVKDAVAGARERDDLCMQWNDAIDMTAGDQTSPARWEGACDLNAPLTMQAMLTLMAMAQPALKRSPLVMVDAVDPDNENKARSQEKFIVSKGNEVGLYRFFCDTWWNACRYPVAIGYCGWKEYETSSLVTKYRQPDSDLLVSRDEQEEDVEYEPVLTRVSSLVSELDIRTVDTTDCYIFPRNARDIQSAIGVGERMMFTAGDLVRGIDQYGFDSDAVEKVIASGRTMSEGRVVEQQNANIYGLGPDDSPQAGYFECFHWYTRMPYHNDLPEEFLDDDFCVFLHPDSETVLRLNHSPYGKRRPYVPFSILTRPGEFLSYCIPQILDSFQCEATANIRLTIDSMNLQITPAWLAQESVKDQNQHNSMFPGAVFTYKKSPDEFQPIQQPQTWVDGLQMDQHLSQEADKLVTAGGFGALPNKSRKAAEIQQVQAAAASKFDMYLSFFQFGIVEFVQSMVALCMEHMDDTGEEFMDETNHKQSVKPADLRGKYIYQAVGSGQTANPEVRLQQAQLADKATIEYWTVAAQMQQVRPDVVKYLWAAKRMYLLDLGIPRPEEYIGPEPEVPEQGAAPQQAQPMGAMNGFGGAGPAQNGLAARQ